MFLTQNISMHAGFLWVVVVCLFVCLFFVCFLCFFVFLFINVSVLLLLFPPPPPPPPPTSPGNKDMVLPRISRKSPLSYFSFHPVLHNWCNKGRGMCYPVCRMVHIEELLLLIDKSSLCGDSGFPFSLSEWSLTICLTPYNRR